MRVPFALLFDAAVAAMLVASTVTFGSSVITGDSMRPALQRGDLVVYRRGARGVVRGSMVVLGESPREYVHRVAAVGPDGLLVTQGDANPIADREPTSTASVRGRVVAMLPTGRLARRLASSGGRARLWSQSHSQR